MLIAECECEEFTKIYKVIIRRAGHRIPLYVTRFAANWLTPMMAIAQAAREADQLYPDCQIMDVPDYSLELEGG